MEKPTKTACNAFIFIALFAASLPSQAETPFKQVHSDSFFDYSIAVYGKASNQVRWSLKNKTDVDLDVGHIKVKYGCNDKLKTHYFSTKITSGSSKAYVGADTACKGAVSDFEVIEVGFRQAGIGYHDNKIKCNDKTRYFLSHQRLPNLFEFRFRDGTKIQWVGKKIKIDDKIHYKFDPNKLNSMVCSTEQSPSFYSKLTRMFRNVVKNQAIANCIKQGQSKKVCKAEYGKKSRAGTIGVRG